MSNISSLLQKSNFEIKVVLNSFQTQKDLDLTVFLEFFDNFFSFVIWHTFQIIQ